MLIVVLCVFNCCDAARQTCPALDFSTCRSSLHGAAIRPIRFLKSLEDGVFFFFFFLDLLINKNRFNNVFSCFNANVSIPGLRVYYILY